ncbi:hypothetical protein BHE74_00016983 [Ensete ventricosum]|nr:hypothetical protein GW17_00020514 [Ensete ventricosum]RWW75012.1 hypothetical protein BHE74_00016983 [Ensete ventricosum]RZR92399.1 hypothetical protein BHM03_00020680 [Ensete ventricosum]
MGQKPRPITKGMRVLISKILLMAFRNLTWIIMMMKMMVPTYPYQLLGLYNVSSLLVLFNFSGIELFSTGLGDVYYPSNDMDPYLQNKDVKIEKTPLEFFSQNDDDGDDEIEDMTIKPNDAVIVCARNEDEISHLEALMLSSKKNNHLQGIDEVQPFLVLGGLSKKKKKEKKRFLTLLVLTCSLIVTHVDIR